MNGKSRSWFLASIYFLFMLGCYLGFSAMSPSIRHQMASIHSLFWTFTLPWTAAGCAVFSVGAWLVAYILAKRQQARAQ